LFSLAMFLAYSINYLFPFRLFYILIWFNAGKFTLNSELSWYICDLIWPLVTSVNFLAGICAYDFYLFDLHGKHINYFCNNFQWQLLITFRYINVIQQLMHLLTHITYQNIFLQIKLIFLLSFNFQHDVYNQPILNVR
jgi:hypothetical protein